jgi:AcrR family transcriptional regulator
MPRRTAPGPRKRPSQARSQATVDAIVDAAARVLVRDGYGAFTTNRVAERAGVSVGSLYQYFPNKDALLAELKARHIADLERGLDEAMARVGDAPLPALVAAVIEANVAAHLIDPALHRVLSAEVPQLGASDAALAFEQRTLARVRALLARRRAEIAVRDLDLATYLVARTVEATIHEAVVERPDDLASGAIAREVTRLLLRYLTVSSPAPRARAARRARTAPRPGTASPRRGRSSPTPSPRAPRPTASRY